MPTPRRLSIIAKQRTFDEAQGKQLLTAMAHSLHDQRKAPAASAAGAPADVTES